MQRVTVLLVLVFCFTVHHGCGGSVEPGASGTSSNAAARAENSDVDIVGEYRYGSELLSGGTETGTVRIQRLGEAYDILMMPTGSPEYPGIGIRNGDHFAICYSLAIERGVGSFTINSDGTLTGHWATLGSDGELLSDTWEKVQ